MAGATATIKRFIANVIPDKLAAEIDFGSHTYTLSVNRNERWIRDGIWDMLPCHAEVLEWELWGLYRQHVP